MRKEIGIGLLATFAAIIGVIVGLTDAAWFRWLIPSMFILGALEWLLTGAGFLIGLYLGGRWWSLVGLIIGTLIFTPVINKREIV